MSRLLKGALLATTLMAAGAASAKTVEITVTNGQATGGLYLTPLVSIFHDGNFDTFDPGSTASGSLEALAEDGNAAPIRADVAAAGTGAISEVIANPNGFPGAPVLDPGEVTTIQIDLDTDTQRFFSFLSMVIPSNDTFIGNGNPEAYELFNAAGEFIFDRVIEVYATDAWDAGTEINDGNGAPFAPPTLDPSADENGVITQVSDLDFLIGRPQAPGGEILSASGLLASISITEVAPVPLPAGLPLLLAGLGAFGLVRGRRKSA